MVVGYVIALPMFGLSASVSDNLLIGSIFTGVSLSGASRFAVFLKPRELVVIMFIQAQRNAAQSFEVP